jgi:hypothetical protein
VPTKAQLSNALQTIKAQIQATAGGADFIFYYSGHGSVRPPEAPRLALHDTSLTQQVLYDEVIAPLNTHYTHLMIDACHAAAIVRPRGASELTSTPLDAQAIGALWRTNTLARFPHVGALIAASANDETHEWSELSHGVFTHELLSGLRGAADVNSDGRIEYSEIHAFIASANENVSDVRAKPRVSATPPMTNQHAALTQLATARGATAWLEGAVARVGRMFIETARGVRLLDVHAEPNHPMRILVPSNEDIFVRTDTEESRVLLAQAETQSLGALRFRQASTKARGSIGQAYASGLFRAQFGPAYYLGFVAGAGAASVDMRTQSRAATRSEPRAASSGSKAVTVVSAIVGSIALASTATFTGLAINASAQRQATLMPLDDADDDNPNPQGAQLQASDPVPYAIVAGASGAMTVVAAILVAVYWPRSAPPVSVTGNVTPTSASLALQVSY